MIEEFAAILSEDKLAKNFNEFFVNIIPNLNLNINKYKVNEVFTSEMTFMTSITEIYKHHPCIKFSETHMEKIDKLNCSFSEIAKSVTVKKIKKLDPRKA